MRTNAAEQGHSARSGQHLSSTCYSCSRTSCTGKTFPRGAIQMGDVKPKYPELAVDRVSSRFLGFPHKNGVGALET